MELVSSFCLGGQDEHVTKHELEDCFLFFRRAASEACYFFFFFLYPIITASPSQFGIPTSADEEDELPYLGRIRPNLQHSSH